MYTTTNTNWTTFLLVVLAGFLALGLVVGASDWLNQTTAAAAAREQDARTAAILAENQYQQQRYAIELAALQAKRDQELVQIQQDYILWSELKEIAALVLVGVLAGAIIVLTGAVAFWIVCQGLRALRMPLEVTEPLRQPAPARRVLLFPRVVWRRKAASQLALRTQRMAKR